MRLSDGLVGGDIIVGAEWLTFEATVEAMVDHLVAAGRVPSAIAATAVRSIREREIMASTAMVDIGVSIPHARVEGVTSLVAALAVSPTAVYRFADDVPIAIVALVLSSPSMAGEHLNFLSTLSLLLQSARNRDALRNAPDAAAVLRLMQATQDMRL